MDSKVRLRQTMVQIRKVNFFKPRYAATDSQGVVTLWDGRLGREGATAEIDGQRYAVRRDGRKRFVLQADGRELASVDRDGRNWKLSSDGTEYGFGKRSAWRSSFELRAAGVPVGTVSRRRRNVICEVPDDLPVAVQTFLGFVAMALWNRDAAAAGGAAAGTSAAVSG
jgi:hypothetical protein